MELSILNITYNINLIYSAAGYEYNNAKYALKDCFHVTIPTFHDTLFSNIKIVWRRKSFLWNTVVGVSFIRIIDICSNYDETKTYTLPIFSGNYYNRTWCYEFEKSTHVGSIEFKVKKSKARCETSVIKNEVGFVDNIFSYIFSNRDTEFIFNLNKLLNEVIKSSQKCKMNIVFGAYLIEKCISEKHNLYREIKSDDEYTISSPFTPTTGSEGVRAVEGMLDILSNDGYNLCSRDSTLECKKLFHFAICAYAGFWPVFFVEKKPVKDNVDPVKRPVLEILGIDQEDLIAVNLDSEIVAHVIFYDKEKNQVVVSFKGTTSSYEVLQDVNCAYEPFEEGYAHKGIKFLTEKFIKKYLEEIKSILKLKNTTKLLLTGHSLGAAISVLANIILSDNNLLEGIQLFSYVFAAPPIVSENIAKNSYDNIIVVNYGNDLISRISFGSVLDLKYLCCSIGEKNKAMQWNREIFREIEVVRKHLKKINLHPKLYLPGILYHLKKITVSNDPGKVKLLSKRVDFTFFEEIILIKHAPLHHVLDHFMRAMDDALYTYEMEDKIAGSKNLA